MLTLGELILALGKHYTAAQIYAFYRTLHIIAVKRRKGKGASAPASGSVKTGVTQSPFQAARMRLELIPNKELLLAEYVAVNNLGHLEPIKENFDLAIRYMFKVMLRDLRPPWLAHTFPRLCQGWVCVPGSRAHFFRMDRGSGDQHIRRNCCEDAR